MASVPTNSLNINVSDAAVEFIQAMVAAGTCADASDLVQQLIDEKQRELDDEWLDAEILKGLNSGPGIEVTDEFWAEKERRLAEWYARTHALQPRERSLTELDEELLKGLNSSPPIEVTPEFWSDIRLDVQKQIDARDF